MSVSRRSLCSFKFTSIKRTTRHRKYLLIHPFSVVLRATANSRRREGEKTKQTNQKSGINITVEIIPFQLVFQRRDREQEKSALSTTAPFQSILPVFSTSQCEAQSHKHHGPAQRRMRLLPTAKFSTARGSPVRQSLPFISSFTAISNTRTTPNLSWKCWRLYTLDADLISNTDSSK